MLCASAATPEAAGGARRGGWRMQPTGGAAWSHCAHGRERQGQRRRGHARGAAPGARLDPPQRPARGRKQCRSAPLRGREDGGGV